MKVIFFGDSITDWKRDRTDINSLGEGYVKIAAKKLKEKYPDITVINKGISGNEVVDLLNRVDNDVLTLNPDIVVVMIGVNNSVHQYKVGKILDFPKFREDLTALIAKLKASVKKVIFLEPYLLPSPEWSIMRELFEKELKVINELVPPAVDLFIPDDEYINALAAENPEGYLYYSPDGIHPNENGAAVIAERAVAAVEKIIKTL